METYEERDTCNRNYIGFDGEEVPDFMDGELCTGVSICIPK